MLHPWKVTHVTPVVTFVNKTSFCSWFDYILKFNYKQGDDLGTCLCFHLRYLCYHRLTFQFKLWDRHLDPTRFWSKSWSLWKKFVILARSMFFFSPEKSNFRQDRFWWMDLRIQFNKREMLRLNKLHDQIIQLIQ